MGQVRPGEGTGGQKAGLGLGLWAAPLTGGLGAGDGPVPSLATHSATGLVESRRQALCVDRTQGAPGRGAPVASLGKECFWEGGGEWIVDGEWERGRERGSSGTQPEGHEKMDP